MLLYIIIKVNPDLKSFENLFRVIIIVIDDDASGIELGCLHISHILPLSYIANSK